MDEKCKNCKFMIEWESCQYQGHGKCRRFPPHINLETSESGEKLVAIYPKVFNGGWCGEHKWKSNSDKYVATFHKE
ncbi:hypothetical protein LCGC14_0432580 [marine sediment metagenome]|uniref:Uncharacterized protein n=1 Tax=marine sediment metagenome TaxID=412755 RepID=A0A0F9STS6_9ZZZZ